MGKGLVFIILIKITAPLRRISQMTWKDLGLLASTSLESEAIINETRIACARTTQRERNDMRIDRFMLIFFLDGSPKSVQLQCSSYLFVNTSVFINVIWERALY